MASKADTRRLTSTPQQDVAIVGASFAGLACATALARAGVAVSVLERKDDPGAKLHTTGILVKDAIDTVPLLDAMPGALVRRVAGVRLYAPNLSHVDLAAPGYYFLATDTPGLMRWLAQQAAAAGADLRLGALFREAERQAQGFDLGEHGTCRYLVGADGPQSRVAKALGLGVNRAFLFGIEHEYAGARIAAPAHLHCFVDKRLAPGYIGWMVAGVGVVQVGLARRVRESASLSPADAMRAFLAKIAPIADFRDRVPDALRWVFDHFQTDLAFNLLLATKPVRQAASLVYFHRKGVFDAQADGQALPRSAPASKL